MIRYFQRLKAKRGFTMIELIIVIAVIAIMAAMILPGLNTRKALVDECDDAAHDIYTVMQSIFTKYSLYEGALNLELKDEKTPNATDKNSYIHFFNRAGGNYPCKADATSFPDMPETCDLFIEVVAVGGIIGDINIGNTFESLLTRGTNTKNSALGELLKNDLETRAELHNGYYYVKVSYEAIAPVPPATTTDKLNPVKVAFASFCKNQLPTYDGSSGFGNYETNNLEFVQNRTNLSNQIIGVFSPYHASGSLGDTGTKLT